jgi:acyl-CoA thioester hydrolase
MRCGCSGYRTWRPRIGTRSRAPRTASNIDLGQSVEGTTWIEGGARGAKSLRRVDFRDSAGRVIVSAATTWAMLDRTSGRPARVRPEVIAPFL